MFDIDKYLQDMRIKEFYPSDSLIEKTKISCEKAARPRAAKHYSKTKGSKLTRAAVIAIPAALMLLVGVLLGAFLFAEKDDPSVVAFYTVDINPSICIHVDENEIVKSIKSQNKDAQKLLESISCEGLSSSSAIELIINAAMDAGYINDTNKYVLVGRFGDANEQALLSLQEQLEADIDDMIQLLIVSGSFEDKQSADELNVSAGLLKLSQMAEGVEIEDNAKVKDVVEQVSQINQYKYKAPYIKAKTDSVGITMNWQELDFSDMGYTGKVVYNIMAAKNKSSFEDMTAVKLDELSFLSTEVQPLSFFVSSESGIPANYSYYAVYAVYADDIYVKSNMVFAEIPKPEPSSTPVVTQSPKPTQTPQPEPMELVSGYVSGEYIKLSWEKNENDDFLGYKVVASKTNEHPSYPEDGYLKYITDEDVTSKSLYEGYGGLKADTYYYFSITYLYDDGSRIIGNAVRLKVPKKADDPKPTKTPEPTTSPTSTPAVYPSTNIGGSIDGSIVSLHWDKISEPALEGYKVMYSFYDTTPVYGESKCYYKYWITNAETTNCSLDITSLNDYEAAKTCYFSITALYEDHTIKKAGNVISFDAPAAAPYPSTNISVSLSGNDVYTAWSQITDERLEGYKVVASFTNSSPSYPADSYAAWITNAGTTSYTIPESYIKGLSGYEPGKTCYFSITAVYSAAKETGAVDSLDYPY